MRLGPVGSQVRDLLPLLTALPSEAQALDLSLDSSANTLRRLEGDDSRTVALMQALASCLRSDPQRALVGHLPGLRARPDQLVASLLRSTRARGIAAAQKIVTVADLGEYSPARLLELRQAGNETVDDFVRAALDVALLDPPRTQAKESDQEGTGDDNAVVDEAAASAALDVLARLRAVAAWAADRGITSIAALWDLGPEQMPPDVAGWWRDLTDLEPASIANAQMTASCDELVRDLLASLPEQRRVVFERRVLNLDRPTLAELGVELGVTRARIGQIETRAVADVIAKLSVARFAPLRWRAHALRNSLGAAAASDDDTTTEIVRALLPAADTNVSDAPRDAAGQLLLWLAGPYRLRDGWLERDGAITPRPSDLAQLADAHGLIDVAAVHDWLNQREIADVFHEAWLSRKGQCRRFGDTLAVWSGSVVDKCVALLALHGEPATAEQLIEGVGEGHSVRGARARFFEDPRLVRVTRTRWALRAWDHEEYTGIADEIGQRIVEGGGRARLTDLVDALTTQFGVAAASVRVYAEAPRFVLADGWVRLRTPDEPYVVTATVAAARGVYATEPGRMSFLVPVDLDVLRGSGRACPQVIAAALGVAPDGRRALAWSGGALVITWPIGAAFGPALGSVRDLAGSVGVSPRG